MILGPFSATVIDVFGSKRDMYPIEDDSGTTGKFRNCAWCLVVGRVELTIL